VLLLANVLGACSAALKRSATHTKATCVASSAPLEKLHGFLVQYSERTHAIDTKRSLMIPLGICFPSMGVHYTALRSAARAAETLGYDSIWMWDHYVSWNDPHESVLECWTTLAALAEATSTIRLGPLVANTTNHHPGRLAKIAATVHLISNGRLELGIGAGGLASEQTPFGIDQGDAATRAARLEEALQIIPALWRGEPVTFTGEQYQLTDAVVAPGLPNPPRIIVGGRSAALARRAGRLADGLNLQWRFRDTFAELFVALDEGLAARGRTRVGFDLSIHAHWADLGNDPVGALAAWETLGFTRALLMAPPTLDPAELAAVARQLW
jgi:alkanesulfonate monooxygenase SsuD/methylene tetrahydromethanopterin reductase-like flavin-dependent oxidoreductase (luciferase family)